MGTNEFDADLEAGAAAIATRVFHGRLSARQVYRLAEEGGWPIFRVHGKLTCRPSAVHAEMLRRERLATGAEQKQAEAA